MGRKRLVLVGIVWVFAVTGANAQTTNSWRVLSGKWELGTNWAINLPPTNNSSVFITNATTKTVTIDATTVLSDSTMTISNLTISAPTGSTNTLLLSDPGTNTPLRVLRLLTLTAGGALVISNGAVQVDKVDTILGISLEDDGNISLSSPSARLVNTNGNLNVGLSGRGALTVSNGLVLAQAIVVGNSSGSQGTLTIAGGTNQVGDLLVVGLNGTGVVSVTDGRLVVTNLDTRVGGGLGGVGLMTVSNGTVLGRAVTVANSAGSRGTLTIAGGTNAILGPLRVGTLNGTGTVWITGGQLVVTNSTTSVGAGSGLVIDGMVTVTNGCAINVSNVNAIVGNRGSGSLTLNGGSMLLTFGNLSAGFTAGADGAIWMNGNSSLIMTNPGSTVFLGTQGAGRMTLSNGTVNTSTAIVGNVAPGVGTLTVAGGTMIVASDFDVGENAGSSGTVWMTGGSLTATNSNQNIGLAGVGQMTLSNGLVQFRRVLIASSNIGTLTIAGGTNTVSTELHVGSANTGTLWLTGGQLVTTNATVMNVGRIGVGQMTQSNGMWLAKDVTVGANAGSRGTLTYAGGTNRIVESTSIALGAGSAGTVWITGGLVDATNGFGFSVGTIGSGQLIVSNGVLRRGLIQVGTTGGSVGTLTVAGGTLEGPAVLQAGNAFATTGTVWITGGTVALTNDSFVQAIGNGGVGFMTVSNGLVTANSINLGIGTAVGRGTLTVAGGTTRVYSTMLLGNYNCTATGFVIVAGGRLDVTNATGNAVLEVRSGSVTLNSGTLTVDQLVITNACGHFNRTGGTLNYNSALLNPNDDTDDDGIPNGYEQSYGFNPLYAADAATDPDGDGFTNLQEFQAGTNPTNSASAFRIVSIQRLTNDNVQISCTTESNKFYQLRIIVPAADGSFPSPVVFAPPPFGPVAGTGSPVTFTLVSEATNTPSRYYRVDLVP